MSRYRTLAGWIILLCFVSMGRLFAQTPQAKNGWPPRKLPPEELVAKLRERARFDDARMPLSKAIEELSQRHGIVIRLDENAIKEADVALDAADATLNDALHRILGPLRLEHFLDDGGLTIAESKTVVAPRIYAAANQILQALRIQLTVELGIAERICPLSVEQRRLLSVKGERAAIEIAIECAALQRTARRVDEAIANPRKLLQASLSATIAERISPQAAAQYQMDIDRRRVFFQHTAVANFVALLDRELILTGEQRRLIHDALDAQWNDDWRPTLTIFQSGGQYLSLIPEQIFVPHLSETQRSSWQAMPRLTVPLARFQPNEFGILAAED